MAGTSEERKREVQKGGVFPGYEQRLLLEVALAEPERALAAWSRWREARGERGLNLVDPASSHLLPLVARRLGELEYDGWESAKLRGVHRKSLTRNVLLLHKTAAALGHLANGGIDAVLVGAAAMALRAYPDRGARYTTQAELWLPGANLERAAALATADGTWRLGGPAQAEYQVLVGADELTLVLRTNFLPESRIAPGADADVRKRCTTTANWTLLAPEEALLHAAVTGLVWTAESFVDWATDVALTLRSYRIDWARVVALAGRYHAGLPLGAALGSLPALGVSVPAEVLRALVQLPKSEIEREAWAMRSERPPLDPQALWAEWRFRFVPDQSRLSALRGFPAYLAGRLGLPGPAALPAYALQVLREARARR